MTHASGGSGPTEGISGFRRQHWLRAHAGTARARLDAIAPLALAGALIWTMASPGITESSARIARAGAAKPTAKVPKPTNITPPEISGSARVGQLLTVSAGSWTGSPTSYAYEWEACSSKGRDCDELSGATQSSYRVISSQDGGTLRATVTAANSGGKASAKSGLTAVVTTGPPVNTVLPIVTGTAEEGKVLEASSGTWAGTEPITYTYQWQSCNSEGKGCANIEGATGSAFLLRSSNVGNTLNVVVTAKNSVEPASATSAASNVVVAGGGTAAVGWGINNGHEQLGAGYRGSYEVNPVTVLGLAHIKQMAIAADSSFALLADGTVRAWGGNSFGQLGDGSFNKGSGTPVAVEEELTGGEVRELHGVKAISAAGTHVLALLEDGTVMTWGGAALGERGNGESGRRTEATAKRRRDVAVEVPALNEVTAIGSGGGADYAVLANGTVEAWGANRTGMLGIGESGPEECTGPKGGKVACSTKPIPVCAVKATAPCSAEDGNLLSGVTAVSAGAEPRTVFGAAYAISNGAVVAWGYNKHGQLGTGTTEGSNVPVPVNLEALEREKGIAENEKVVAVSGGDIFALALLKDGEVIGWGANAVGQLGGTSSEGKPKLVEGLKHVTAISAGESFSLALSEHTLYSWGDNERGQLGRGSGAEMCGKASCSTEPTAISIGSSGSPPVSGMVAGNGPSVGHAHSLAFLQSGSPPAPLLTLVPNSESLEVVWTFSSPEVKLRLAPTEPTAAGREKEQKVEEDEQALEEASTEAEEAALETEITKLEKEINAETKWSKEVKIGEVEAKSCSSKEPCHHVLESYEGEKLKLEPYAVQVNPVEGTDRTITGTPSA